MKIYILIIITLFTMLLYSNTLVVKQDGTEDYTVIQSAVDDANAGDTIRVYPGTYYENIEVRKNLSIVSNYEYTNDETYIYNTILDGNNISSIFMFEGDINTYINTYLCGFTIIHGSGYKVFENSFEKYGGGIFAKYTNITLKKNQIKYNKALSGGGCYLWNAPNILIGNSIHHNQAYNTTGGLITAHCSTFFDEIDKNSVYLNYAEMANDIFYAYLNNNEPVHILLDTLTVVNSYLPYYYVYATYTGGYYNPEILTLEAEHSYIQNSINADLYVSPTGNNTNSGLSAGEPLKTISYALNIIYADSLNHHTIHIADGIYSPSTNNEKLGLHLKPYVSLIGESQENTILDAEYKSPFFHVYDHDGYAFFSRDFDIKNFKLIHGADESLIMLNFCDNINLENIEIVDTDGTNNSAIGEIYNCNIDVKNYSVHGGTPGRALRFHACGYGRDVSITNFKFYDASFFTNYDGILGGVLGLHLSNNSNSYYPTINVFNAFIANTVSYFDPEDVALGWMGTNCLYAVWHAKINLINATFTHNLWDETSSDHVSAVQLDMDAKLSIYNSILWNNPPRELALISLPGHHNTLNVTHSLVEGSEEEIYQEGTNIINWDDETNLDENPYFMNSEDNPFALSRMSPCINAGTLDLPEGVEMPATDLAGNPRVVGNGIDMGAYEYQGVGTHQDVITPQKKTLITVYPNPFSIRRAGIKSSVKIQLDLADEGKIDLSIYNLKGQKVKELINAQTTQGVLNANWELKNDNGKRISTGIYFVRLTENGKTTQTKRLTIIK